MIEDPYSSGRLSETTELRLTQLALTAGRQGPRLEKFYDQVGRSGLDDWRGGAPYRPRVRL